MSTAISEAASEKRGRPATLEPWEVDRIGPLFTQSKTRRGRQDGFYIGEAVKAIVDCRERGEDWFAWFAKPDSSLPRDNKQAILAQLGRVLVDYGEDTMIQWAKELPPCTAKQGAMILRQWRTGRRQAGTVDDLLLHLAKAIDEYEAAHDTTDETKRAAIGKLMMIV